ncbi:MAG: amino acid permease [Flavobacteriales bacterium]|nr:amino acid permease [Flavobacteriales bacterium]
MSQQKYTRSVAISMVVANMIGTGVFTSIGFQVGGLPSAFVILFLWFIGGIIALAGALSYAEVSTRIPGSGGEYNYLSHIYHPSLGFVSGWMSLIAGFSAPICVVAIAIGKYFSPVIGVEDIRIIAVTFIVLVSAIQLFGVRIGGEIQKYLTIYKILLIALFCLAPFLVSDFVGTNYSFTPQKGDWDLIMSPAFAISLAYIMYAYSGWNASTYIAGLLENPSKNLPVSLLFGTIIVTVLYVALNGMFLTVGTFEEIGVKPPNFDEVDVGNIVANKLFGSGIGTVFSALITFALVSSLSAMVIAGPRVYEQIGKDYPVFNLLTRSNKLGSPYIAIILQAAIAITMVLTSSFHFVINYIAVSLSVFSSLTVLGAIILRWRKTNVEGKFNSPLFPLAPIVFLLANGWFLYYMVSKELEEKDFGIIWFSLSTMLIGFIIYGIVHWKKSAQS